MVRGEEKSKVHVRGGGGDPRNQQEKRKAFVGRTGKKAFLKNKCADNRKI